MKIHTTKLTGFYGHSSGTLQVLFFAPCLRPHRAEDKVQIKAQLGGLPVRVFSQPAEQPLWSTPERPVGSQRGGKNDLRASKGGEGSREVPF